MKKKILIIKALGGFPFKFEWGWIIGKEKEGGLGVQVGELCLCDTPPDKFKFNAGMVITKKDAIRLQNFIRRNVTPKNK